MRLEDIASDDILVFDEEISIDDEYAINGMLGHLALVVDSGGEMVEQIPIEDLSNELRSKVMQVIENNLFEISYND